MGRKREVRANKYVLEKDRESEGWRERQRERERDGEEDRECGGWRGNTYLFLAVVFVSFDPMIPFNTELLRK